MSETERGDAKRGQCGEEEMRRGWEGKGKECEREWY